MNYFAPCNPDCPVAQANVMVNRMQWNTWMEILPALEDDADLSFRSVARRSGVTVYRAECIVRGLYVMSFLPRLTRLQEKWWMLDLERICAIGRALKGVTDYELVDVMLADLFTPTRPGQHLPEPAEIRRAIEELLNITRQEEKVKDRYLTLKTGTDSLITFVSDPTTIEAIDRLVEKRARKDGIDKSEALVALILDPVKTSVVVNLFQREGSSLAYLPGTGFVEPQGQTRELSPGEVKGYRPSEAIRAFVEARDGTCRWPGCKVPAHRCQLDHRIEFDRGGMTSTDNLVCLCAHHHNIKTDRRAFYVLDPVSGDIYWLFTDGTWEATVPEGVTGSNWRMTVAQRLGFIDEEELSFATA